MFRDSKTGRISCPVPVCSPANLKRWTARSRSRHREQNWAETDWINLELYPSWNNDVRKSIRIEVLASWSPEVMSFWCAKILSPWIREFQRSRTHDLRIPWCPDFKKSWDLKHTPCWSLGLMASWSPGLCPLYLWRLWRLKDRTLLFLRLCTPATDANRCHSDANHCHRALIAEDTSLKPLYSLPKP